MVSKINPSELEKINIENLFSSANGNRPYTNGRLDINTLFKNKSNNKDFKFDSDFLLNDVRKRKEKLSDTYMNIYKLCCDKIVSANSVGITDIIYEAPHFVPECTLYNTKECLKFIREKLDEEKISCLMLSKTKIFITWHDLEEKIKSDSA